jgi:hypothetical protein
MEARTASPQYSQTGALRLPRLPSTGQRVRRLQAGRQDGPAWQREWEKHARAHNPTLYLINKLSDLVREFSDRITALRWSNGVREGEAITPRRCIGATPSLSSDCIPQHGGWGVQTQPGQIHFFDGSGGKSSQTAKTSSHLQLSKGRNSTTCLDGSLATTIFTNTYTRPTRRHVRHGAEVSRRAGVAELSQLSARGAGANACLAQA